MKLSSEGTASCTGKQANSIKSPVTTQIPPQKSIDTQSCHLDIQFLTCLDLNLKLLHELPTIRDTEAAI